VLAHNGEINIVDTERNKGAHFVVQLPQHQAG
jgi:signal transduction histidine kinase